MLKWQLTYPKQKRSTFLFVPLLFCGLPMTHTLRHHHHHRCLTIVHHHHHRWLMMILIIIVYHHHHHPIRRRHTTTSTTVRNPSAACSQSHTRGTCRVRRRLGCRRGCMPPCSSFLMQHLNY